ncbi:MAG: sugar phosphate isomerase/epimerase [Victivallales bacterium]|nr:sugar phosphate isomerase/epimerase [Victivallales bacterium]
MKIGIQLYNFRQQLDADFTGTLRKVAALGADGVEFYAYGGLQPAELARLMAELGLECAGTMFGPDQLQDPENIAWEYAKALASPAVTISCMLDFTARWKEVRDICQAIGRNAAAHGIPFSYPNHWAEFAKVDGTTAMERILAECDPKEVLMEPDICWLTRGGENPPDFLRRHGGRIRQVHFKDIKQPEVPETTTPLGTGVVDVVGSLKAAREIGAEWITYEQDFTDEPFECARRSLAYLKEQLSQLG